MKPIPLLALLLGLVPALRAAEPPPAHSEVTDALRDWLGASPGGVAAALVDADGTTSFHEAGHFSAANPRLVTADTQFEIGSLTKVFTALLLADAAQEGKLALDTPIGRSKISYEQLATHTSGLPRLPEDFDPADPANPYKSCDLASLKKSFERALPKAHPSAPDYSNFGYAVLGQAIASAWGEAYSPLLRRRVLTPLGLTDTLLDWRDADRARLAPGHDGTQPAKNWDFAAYAPAGALVSTTRDLAKFLRACFARDPEPPLRAALVETLRERGPDLPGVGKAALAWQIVRGGGATIYWHNGGTGGYRSFLTFCPTTGKGIVLLTNHTRDLEVLGFSLLAGKRPPPPETPPAEATAPELLPYLGDYPLSRSFVIAVTATGQDLFIQATGQSRLRLKRLQPDRYAVEGVEAAIVFERDSAGTVTALVLEQNGARQRAPRKPAEGGR